MLYYNVHGCIYIYALSRVQRKMLYIYIIQYVRVYLSLYMFIILLLLISLLYNMHSHALHWDKLVKYHIHVHLVV